MGGDLLSAIRGGRFYLGAGVLPPTSWWSTVDRPLPLEVGSGSTAAMGLPVPCHKAKESVGAPGDPYAPYDNL